MNSQRTAPSSQVVRTGTGRRPDPFRYWLPDKEAEWKRDPMYEFHRLLEERMKDWPRECRG